MWLGEYSGELLPCTRTFKDGCKWFMFLLPGEDLSSMSWASLVLYHSSGASSWPFISYFCNFFRPEKIRWPARNKSWLSSWQWSIYNASAHSYSRMQLRTYQIHHVILISDRSVQIEYLSTTGSGKEYFSIRDFASINCVPHPAPHPIFHHISPAHTGSKISTLNDKVFSTSVNLFSALCF